MFGYRTKNRHYVRKYGRSTRPLRLEILERRDQPASMFMSVLPALHETAIEPAIDFRALTGLTPAMVRNAYGFDASNIANTPGDGAGQTIAIVTAFNNPYIQSDLRRFNEAFGLPDAPSFRVVSAGTATHYGWATEAALDVQWAHAIAPAANLLLVQAASDSISDMLQAVDFARRQEGVSVVSMSWGANEFLGQTRYDGIFSTPFGHQPVAFVAASGDFGAAGGVMWPASSPSVLAVGGTRLNLDASGNYSGETAWAGSGGGISRFYTNSVTSSVRAVPDVAYAADPGSGFLVYNSMPDARGRSGWFRVGGTSAGAPQWSGLIAIADEARAANNVMPIGNARAAISQITSDAFNDVVAGSNGFEAGIGFDLATGVGSPKASNVIAQLTAQQPGKAPAMVGPMQEATLTPAKRTTTAPPTRDVTQALIQAALSQQNAVRAELYVNTGPARTPADVETRVDEVTPPPVLVAPVSSAAIFTTWDQSIRAGSGSSEVEGPNVPELPGGADPAPPPAGAIKVGPSSRTHSTVQTSGKRNATSTASRHATTTTESSDVGDIRMDSDGQATFGLAAAFCFIGGCFVGVEPRENGKKRPVIK